MENFVSDTIDASTEKILFAQDLMHFMMSKTGWPEYRPNKMERFRPFVKTTFTPITGLAVRYLEKILERTMYGHFEFVLANYQVTLDGFEMYAKHFAMMCFAQGFEVVIFLQFCVRLGTVALYFYNNGVKEAPYSAIYEIANCVKHEFDYSTWKLLNRTALNYAKIDELLEDMTPESEED